MNRKESGVVHQGIKEFAGKRLKEIEEFYNDNLFRPKSVNPIFVDLMLICESEDNV